MEYILDITPLPGNLDADVAQPPTSDVSSFSSSGYQFVNVVDSIGCCQLSFLSHFMCRSERKTRFTIVFLLFGYLY